MLRYIFSIAVVGFYAGLTISTFSTDSIGLGGKVTLGSLIFLAASLSVFCIIKGAQSND